MTKSLIIESRERTVRQRCSGDYKMAAESKEVLSGAVFEVHDEKGKVVVKVTTDKDGKAKSQIYL